MLVMSSALLFSPVNWKPPKVMLLPASIFAGLFRLSAEEVALLPSVSVATMFVPAAMMTGLGSLACRAWVKLGSAAPSGLVTLLLAGIVSPEPRSTDPAAIRLSVLVSSPAWVGEDIRVP